MKPSEYRKAARRLARLAGRVSDTAGADTARQRAARTRVVNLLAQEARRLFERNAGDEGQKSSASRSTTLYAALLQEN